MGARGSFDRAQALHRLEHDHFDVLVVGGGITGAGVALDAAARGLRTALVERDDFAAGTSSKSSKLVHGGLRYLQAGDIGLVYEALAERQRLRTNAPHLVKVLPFLIPILTGRDRVVPKGVARALGSAMWAYDLTGGLRIGRRHRRISAEAALEYMPTLRTNRVAWAYLYYDAQADDARLTLAVARTAALDFGAVVANRCRLVGVHRNGRGHVRAATVDVNGAQLDVSCSSIVNATGVWADEVRALDEGQHPQSIRPAKGIHITVPWQKVQNHIAVVLPVPKDRRSVFVVPWGDFTYIGTTDTDYDGSLNDPQCTRGDIDYLLGAVNRSMANELIDADIVGTWAGLRPLVRDTESERTADLSRRHQVTTSPSGVITITGGKLTTYRAMAADAVAAVLDVLGDQVAGRVSRRSPTKRLRLRGANGYDEARAANEHLADRYGGESRVLAAMIEGDPALGEPLVPGLPYLAAEAVYAARYEMALTLDDILSRRTRARVLGRAATGTAAPAVAALVADDLGWDESEQARQVADYRASVAHEEELHHLLETLPINGLEPERRDP